MDRLGLGGRERAVAHDIRSVMLCVTRHRSTPGRPRIIAPRGLGMYCALRHGVVDRVGDLGQVLVVPRDREGLADRARRVEADAGVGPVGRSERVGGMPAATYG